MGKSENKSSKLGFLPWLAATAVIVLVFGFVMPRFIVIPNLFPEPMSQQHACINGLRQIDGAKQEWALENGKTNGVVCTIEDIKPYIKLDAKGNIPRCPSGGIYAIGKIGEPPICSLGKTNSAHVLP